MEEQGSKTEKSKVAGDSPPIRTVAHRPLMAKWTIRFVTVVVLAGLVAGAATWWRDRPPAGLAQRLTTDEGNLNCVAFNRDGSRLAAGGASGKIFLWEMPVGSPLTLFQYSQQPVTSLTTTADGFLVAATLSKRMLVWDLQTRKARAIPPLTAPITCIAAHPSREELVIGFSDGTLQFLDTKSAEFTSITSEHRGSVKSLAYDPNAEFLVSGGADGSIIYRDALSRDVLRTLTVNGEVSSLCFSRDAKLLVSGSWNGDVTVWNSRNDQRLHRYHHDSSVSGVGIAGNLVVSSGWDGHLRFWTPGSADQISGYDIGSAIHAMTVSPDEKTVATVSAENRVNIWKVP